MSTVESLISELDTLAESLITDRDSTDISELQDLLNQRFQDLSAADKAKLISPHKGAYGPSDMNRVGTFCNTFVELMELLGYETLGYETMRTDWENIYDFSSHQLNSYIEIIRKFKDQWNYLNTTFQNDISRGISLDSANNIERMLSYALDVIEEMLKITRYCGQLYCGQTVQWIGGYSG